MLSRRHRSRGLANARCWQRLAVESEAAQPAGGDNAAKSGLRRSIILHGVMSHRPVSFVTGRARTVA
jgi:hypothetical protein